MRIKHQAAVELGGGMKMGISLVRNLMALFALWSSACSVAHASDWRHLGQDEKYIYSIDLDSLAVVDSLIEVWLKTEYINDLNIYRTMQFVKFNCKSRRFLIDRMILFNKNGVTDDWNPRTGWVSPAPDTLMEARMKSFCKR